MIKKTLGGDRLGSGNKMQIEMHNYERSTHDLSRVVRTTMGPGTLVPFFTEIGLPGDTFDIDLETMTRTLPTVGPLMGSFKLQVDMFVIPVRLYIAGLHMNLFNVGLKMDKMLLPMMKVDYITPKGLVTAENKTQIEPSSLMAYLGLRGGGNTTTMANDSFLYRNALFLLGYWDIYKQYYSNRAEGIGYYIRPTIAGDGYLANKITKEYGQMGQDFSINTNGDFDGDMIIDGNQGWDRIIIEAAFGYIPSSAELYNGSTSNWHNLEEIGSITREANRVIITNDNRFNEYAEFSIITKSTTGVPVYNEITLDSFDLDNIDTLKKAILRQDENSPFVIDRNTLEPYGTCVGKLQDGNKYYYCNQFSQNGLGIKTYLSDLFNNWLDTDWVNGANGISQLTAVDVSDGYLKLDVLNFAKKLYNVLNRVMASGGSYEDRTEAVYGMNVSRRMETPMYMGGLSREIVFEEVVSTVEKDSTNPLGTLAGKGNQSEFKKGGHLTIKIDQEECIIMGIASITPRVDYSTGNKWYTNLETMNDFHQPGLDGIGFQNLVTEQMHAQDSTFNEQTLNTEFRSAGMQPAWINYMTAYNENFGEFAKEDSLMYMTLNRRYQVESGTGFIKNLTTYIDPTLYNYAFADTALDAQNFIMQFGAKVIKRGKISAKIIPTL